jgi:hypothetical protein
MREMTSNQQFQVDFSGVLGDNLVMTQNVLLVRFVSLNSSFAPFIVENRKLLPYYLDEKMPINSIPNKGGKSLHEFITTSRFICQPGKGACPPSLLNE